MEAETPAPDISNEPPKKRRHRKLIFGIFLILLVIGTGLSLWYINQPVKAPQKQISKVKQKPAKVEPAKDPALVRFLAPTTGETWLSPQKKLPDQAFFVENDGFASPARYYEAGKRQGNTIILAVAELGLGTTSILFEKTPAGVLSVILQPDSEATYNQDDMQWMKEIIKPEIVRDTTTRYDSLSLPRKLDLDKGDVVSKPAYPSIGDFIEADAMSTGSPSEVKKLGQSVLKKNEHSYVDTKLTSIGYYLQTPINTKVNLNYEPLEIDLSNYQWSAGTSPSDKLRPISRGCGGLGTSITRGDAITDVDTQAIGKSPSGQIVYQLKEPSHPLLQKAYEEFKEYASSDPSTYYPASTKEGFIKEHGLVLYKDKFGQWLVYARDQLSPAYGCAKPVVYLYPTHTQEVSVKVGADVKLSDPFYNPRTGWQVIARPDGQLTLEGKAYSSLFWEGPGIGQYPSITSGTIVKTSDALATIKKQLAQQGLNQQETNDFIDYWQDKLPTKPYTRLTWFNTAQLNELAPLTITPRPDTTIRVFLDFAGLDQPTKLPAQKLQKVPRSGFTVIEWGGLSPKKLY